jgi:hypothetical protein
MKYLKTFEQFINESSINEKRVNFKGKKVGDLYKIIKNVDSAEFFAKGKTYGIEADDIKHDLNDTTVFGFDEDGGEHEIRINDIEFIELFENAPSLNTSGVKPGEIVEIDGEEITVIEIYKQINGSIIEFKGSNEDGDEATYIYDDGCDDYIKEREEGLSKAGHAALGMKQVRIVISGDSVEKNADKILKFITKADPNSNCDFYDKTGKIVGTFAKAKMDNIKRDLKSIDHKITIEIKDQKLK